MLLKCSPKQRPVPATSRERDITKGKGKLIRSAAMKMVSVTSANTSSSSKLHRKVLRMPSKRHPGKVLPGKLNTLMKMSSGKLIPGKRILARPTSNLCDNSNDSGLGFDQHLESFNAFGIRSLPINRSTHIIDDTYIDVDDDDDDENDVDDDIRRVNKHRHRDDNDDDMMDGNDNDVLNSSDKDSTDENDDEKLNIYKINMGHCNNINNIHNNNNNNNNMHINSSSNNNNKRPRYDATPTSTTTSTLKKNLNLDLDDDNCSNDVFNLIQQNKLNNKKNVGDNTNTTKILGQNRNTSKLSSYKQRINASSVQAQCNSTASSDGKSYLQIIAQPEQQHRARYQTEGSRGAVKDRSGNGFPVVKLVGYNKSAVLQVFIGTDVGRVTPHMFYQACKVSGKNSTPCVERKQDGTMLIEIDLKAENEMIVTCDCVGILKERNVDVEHRFPDQSGPRSKKKSTRCRMVFRTVITNNDGSTEVLQVCSQPIICTQPPGVPEISKKSLTSCPATGGLELFIIGKNFLKDTKVVFNKPGHTLPNIENNIHWEESVSPDKEFLQQTHLICVVPPFMDTEITEPVKVQIYILSSGKKSEAHNFLYTPNNYHNVLTAATTIATFDMQNSEKDCQDTMLYTDDTSNSSNHSIIMWNNMEIKNDLDTGMMPPPSALPTITRRPSGNMLTSVDQMNVKAELMDENSRNSMIDSMSTTETSLDRFPNMSVDNAMEYSPHSKIDLIKVESNLSMIVNNSNAMDSISSGFPEHSNHIVGLNMNDLKVMDLRVKQEQLITNNLATNNNCRNLANMEQYIDNNSNNNISTIIATSPTETHVVDKFIPNLTEANQLNQLVAANNAAVNHLFGNAAPNPTDVLFPQNVSNMSQMHIAVQNTEETLQQMLEQQQIHSPIDSLISSPNSTIRSPLSQDMILNAHSSLSMNNPNLSLMTSNQHQQEHAVMSPEIILNPTVSPSMMCHQTAAVNDPNNLLSPHQCLINTQIISNTLIEQQQQQQQQQNQSPLDTLINQQQHQTSPIQHIPRKTPSVAVKNMILNAAAEILTSQQPCVETQTTINALISLDEQQQQQQQQQQHQHLPDLYNEQHHQQHLHHHHQMTLMQMSQQQQIQQNTNNILDNCHNMNNMVANSQLLSNNLNGVVVENQQMQLNSMHESFLNTNLSKHDAEIRQVVHSAVKHQESLLQAVSLVPNIQTALEQTKNATSEENATTELSLMNKQIETNNQQATTNAAIPQELTSMSDNDLISYINPSCFDQV